MQQRMSLGYHSQFLPDLAFVPIRRWQDLRKAGERRVLSIEIGDEVYPRLFSLDGKDETKLKDALRRAPIQAEEVSKHRVELLAQRCYCLWQDVW